MDRQQFYKLNDETSKTVNIADLQQALSDWVKKNQKHKLIQYYESGKFDAFFDAVVENYKRDHATYIFYRGIIISPESHKEMYDSMLGKKPGDKVIINGSLYSLQSFTLKEYYASYVAKSNEEDANDGDLGIVLKYDMPQNQDWRIAYYSDLLSDWMYTGYEHESEVIIYVDDVISGGGNVECELYKISMFYDGKWNRLRENESIQYFNNQKDVTL